MFDDEDDLHVDLTPLIDVIFMLVIFFIMTMSFSLPVVEFALPQSSTAQLEDKSNAVRISVNADGTFIYAEAPLSLEQFTEILKHKSESGEKISLEVVIDKHAASQHLIELADLARLYTQGRLLVVAEVTKN